MNEYTKLSELVNKTFTLQSVLGFGWKRWNKDTEKYEFSKEFQKFSDGWTKKYFLQTDKGKLEVTEGQLARMLTPTLKGNVADLSNAKYEVASNGKTGMEVRYYFNFKGKAEGEIQLDNEGAQDEVNIDSIPF